MLGFGQIWGQEYKETLWPPYTKGSITYYGDCGFGYVLKGICPHTCTSIQKRENNIGCAKARLCNHVNRSGVVSS